MIFTLNYCEKNRKCIFLIQNIDISIINALRHIIISDIKNSGINSKNISIIKNTSVINNELLQHRISLIPIYSIETNELKKVHLNIINTKNYPIFATSNNIQTFDENIKIFENIIICKLKKNEELQFVAHVDYNTGEHIDIYKPVINVYFRKLKFIYILKNKNFEINLKKINQYFDKCKFNLYTNLQEFNFANKIQKKNYKCVGFSTNLNDFELDELTKFLDMNADNLIIEDLENIYVFCIEYIFIKPKKLLLIAFNILQNKLQHFFIENEHNCEIEKEKINEKKTSIKIILNVENISCQIANVISYFINKNKHIIFAHYHKKHPFDSTILFIIYLHFEKNIDEIYLKNIINFFQEIMNEVYTTNISELKNIFVQLDQN